MNDIEFDKLVIDTLVEKHGAEFWYKLGLDDNTSKNITHAQDVLLSKIFRTVEKLLRAEPEYHI